VSEWHWGGCTQLKEIETVCLSAWIQDIDDDYDEAEGVRIRWELQYGTWDEWFFTKIINLSTFHSAVCFILQSILNILNILNIFEFIPSFRQ